MGCCHYISTHQNELLNLDKEIERQRLHELKYANNNNNNNAFNHNSLSDFFASDSKRVLMHNTSITSKNDFKHVNSRLSYESFDHGDIIPLTIASSLFNEINHLRTCPTDFATKVQHYADMIQYNNTQGWFINVNERQILLNQNKDYFINAVEYLHSIQPMHALMFDNDLTIPLHSNNCTSCSSSDIETQIELIKQRNVNKYKECYIITDKNVSNVEFVAVYNYVDLCNNNNNDNNNNNNNILRKRNMLLNRTIHNVGISVCKIDAVNGVYCYIIIFGIEHNNSNDTL